MKFAPLKSVAVTLFILVAGLQLPETATDTIQVITRFESQLPPQEGASVCLEGSVEPIGKVSGVRILSGHVQRHDGWEVSMDLEASHASRITQDSIAYSMTGKQLVCKTSDAIWVEIKACKSSRPSKAEFRRVPIGNHSLLKGEPAYAAEIGYF